MIAKRIAAGLLLVVGWVSMPNIAQAGNSYEGSDYSYQWSGIYITTCDQEADSTKVKGIADDDWSGSGASRAWDVDGANGICADGNHSLTIARTRTCEYRAAWPDSCGNWAA
jgi:hypothetical protein